MEGNVADDVTMTTDDKSKEGVKSDTADGATEQKQDGDNSNDTTASNVEVEGDYNDGVPMILTMIITVPQHHPTIVIAMTTMMIIHQPAPMLPKQESIDI